MAAPQGRRVTVTIPEGAPPGTVLSIPVKEGEPVQIRVPPGLGPGSTVKLTKFDAASEWEVEVGTIVPPAEVEDSQQESPQQKQQELAALWDLQQQVPDLQSDVAVAFGGSVPQDEGAIPQLRASDGFRPASTFEGHMPNYVFKLDILGLGYYPDEPVSAEDRPSDCVYPQSERVPALPVPLAAEDRSLLERQRQEEEELEKQRREEEEELRLLQEQQARLQLQRRTEEMQRQRLIEQQEQRLLESSSGPGNTQQVPVANDATSTKFEPEAPQMANGTGDEIAYTVRLNTSIGEIDVIIRPDWAPNGARRFLELVAAGELDDLFFYRAIDGCIAQFGLPAKRKWDPILDDTSCGVPFLHGAVCFAALGENSRRSTLFICTGDMSHCLGQKPWETVIGAIAESSLGNLDRIDTSYGDIHEFGGAGPDTGRITAEGNGYLRQYFPKLTHIRTAQPLDWEPENPQDDAPSPLRMGIKQVPPCAPDGVDHSLIAAEAARDAQDEAAKAARLAASATTAEQAEAAAQAARNAAHFAKQAQEAAAAAQAQVEAARMLLQQPPALALPAVPAVPSTPTKRPSIAARPTPPQQVMEIHRECIGTPSRSTTPCPQRQVRTSGTVPGFSPVGLQPCSSYSPMPQRVVAPAEPSSSYIPMPQRSGTPMRQRNPPSYVSPMPGAQVGRASYTPAPQRNSTGMASSSSSSCLPSGLLTSMAMPHCQQQRQPTGVLDINNSLFMEAPLQQLHVQRQAATAASPMIHPVAGDPGCFAQRQINVQRNCSQMPQQPAQQQLSWVPAPVPQSQWVQQSPQPLGQPQQQQGAPQMALAQPTVLQQPQSLQFPMLQLPQSLQFPSAQLRGESANVPAGAGFNLAFAEMQQNQQPMQMITGWGATQGR